MSSLTLRALQLGISGTPSDNFHLRTLPSPAGTLRLSRGNMGAPLQDVMEVSPAGVMSFPQGVFAGNELGIRNRIVNGNLIINNRAGTTRSTPGYLVDRWGLQLSGFAPTLGFANSNFAVSKWGNRHLYIQAGTARPTPGANDFALLSQRIEGYLFEDARFGRSDARPLTFQFRALSTVAGQTMGVAFRNVNNDRSYTTSVTLNTAATDYSIQIPGCTTGSWGTGTAAGLDVVFCTGIGTTYAAPTANAWLSSNYVAPPGMSNGFLSVGQYVALADFQLEVGGVGTAFESRPAPLENLLCERYYEVMDGVSTAPRPAWTRFAYQVTKRAAPSVTLLTGSLQGANYNAGTTGFYCPDTTVAVGTSGWTLAFDSDY